MNGKVTYRQQYTRCGKQRCRKCKEGAGHGPYWYAYWSENGRTISKYIGIHPPDEIPVHQIFSASTKEHAKPKGSDGLSSVKAPAPSKSTESSVGAEGNQSQGRFFSETIGTQPILRVSLLGQFSIESKEGNEWRTIANRTWQRRRARALLGCLLSQTGRRMGREQIMEALWPDLDIETAANRLNGAVHELRQILEPEIARPAASKMLRLERDILILADSSSIWVDAEAFEVLLNRANTTSDPLLLEQLLEQAAALYEGDYLLEELYSAWATARRETLRRGWMGLLLELARLRSTRGALTSAIEPLDRLLTADPTHETAVRRLMVLLTQLDRRGEAIRAYQRLAEILKREYESEPLSETVQLYQELRQGQAQVVPPVTGTPDHTPPEREQAVQNQTHTQGNIGIPQQHPKGPDPAPALIASSRPVPALGRHNQSPLIGREQELETIRQMMLAIDSISPQAIADERKKIGEPQRGSRTAHFVMVMGETGIGKTRIAEEFSHEVQARGWLVAWTRAYEQEGTIPYRPWTDILRTLLRDLPLAQIIHMLEGKTESNETSGALNPPATASAKLARLGSLLPELTTHQELAIPQNRPATPEQERLHLWEAVLSLLSALSQSTPLLFVMDDLHWTDDSSLELLAYLARHLPNERIMWIGTCRDMELAPSASLRALLNDLRREQVLVTLPLRSLTQDQIGRLLAHLPGSMVQSIQSQAGGNPLFAEELARFSETTPGKSTGKNGKNNGHEPGDASTPGLKGANLPETIAAVLERRLNMLSGNCQTLLSKAAVLGGSFEFRLLLRMTGETGPGEDAALDLLEEALRSGLLTEVVNGAGIVYHFWHPLIVSHLYERLSAARRAQLHRRAAQALIELHSSNETEGAAAIVHHLGKYGHEKQKFAYYAEIAGNQARAIWAYPEALHYYRQALQVLQTSNSSSTMDETSVIHVAHLLECMAECNAIQGNFAEARQEYLQVLELHNARNVDASSFASQEEFVAWQQEEAQVQGMIWRAIGQSWKYPGNYRQAHECAEKGRQVLLAAEITTGAAWACLQHLDGGIYWSEGNFDEARRCVQESLEIHQEVLRQNQMQKQVQSKSSYKTNLSAPLITRSRRALLGDPLELGKAHESLGVIAASTARYPESLSHLHTALAIFEEHDLVGAMSQICSNIGALNAIRAEYETASTYFKRALELAERTGDIPGKVLVTGNLGDIAARAGDLQDALAWLTNSLTLAEHMFDREHSSWCLIALASVKQELGDTRGALEDLRRALVAAYHMKSSVRLGFALVTLADWRVTRALLLSNLEAQNQDKDVNRHVYMTSTVQSLLRSAQAAAERALALEGIDVETQGTGQVVLAHIYYLLGDLESAQQQTLKALEETQRSEMVFLFGRAQRLLGEIQAARDFEQEAVHSFEQSLQTFKQYGLRLDYARTLHKYGFCLLQCGSQARAGRRTPAEQERLYQQGLDYLYEARNIFATCQASLDLQWIEHILAAYPLPYAGKANRSLPGSAP